jgi:hypothetical protein
MNTIIVFLIVLFSLPVLALNLNTRDKNDKDCCKTILNQNDNSLIDSNLIDISDVELNGLIHMRVEEKLARDVYITLGKIWSVRIFQNIQKSEQRHMNAMKRLLDIYEISDPAENDEVGIFSMVEFQKLYDELVQRGTASFNDAMLVGRAIEELDISDLENQLVLVDNPGIKNVYENLKAASERHLKAFNRHIKKN